MLLHFRPFTGRVENKVLWISEITQHFQKCFTYNDRGTWTLHKKCAAQQSVSTQLSVPYPGGKWVAWKKVKTLNNLGK